MQAAEPFNKAPVRMYKAKKKWKFTRRSLNESRTNQASFKSSALRKQINKHHTQLCHRLSRLRNKGMPKDLKKCVPPRHGAQNKFGLNGGKTSQNTRTLFGVGAEAKKRKYGEGGEEATIVRANKRAAKITGEREREGYYSIDRHMRGRHAKEGSGASKRRRTKPRARGNKGAERNERKRRGTPCARAAKSWLRWPKFEVVKVARRSDVTCARRSLAPRRGGVHVHRYVNSTYIYVCVCLPPLCLRNSATFGFRAWTNCGLHNGR